MISYGLVQLHYIHTTRLLSILRVFRPSPRYPPLQAAFWAQTEENYCIDIPPDTGSVAWTVLADVVW